MDDMQVYNEVQAERIQDIRQHPERHRHTFDELIVCAKGPAGFGIDAIVVDGHEGTVGMPTSKCDIISGLCACGATHQISIR